MAEHDPTPKSDHAPPLVLRTRRAGSVATVRPPKVDPALPALPQRPHVGQNQEPPLTVAINIVFAVEGAPVVTLPLRAVGPMPPAGQPVALGIQLDARPFVAQLAAACGYVPAQSVAAAKKIWTPHD